MSIVKETKTYCSGSGITFITTTFEDGSEVITEE